MKETNENASINLEIEELEGKIAPIELDSFSFGAANH